MTSNHFAFVIRRAVAASLAIILCAATLPAQDSLYVLQHYTKREALIAMRDGVKLFTAIYIPRDTTHRYPFMMNRTPYNVAPYGPGAYKTSLGPSSAFVHEGYIFVYQDVRGCWMSEGEYVNVTPHNAVKRSAYDVDESSDTYDTVDWLLKNIPHNNGRVGIWGISYPGFYAAAGMIDAHPALVAVSPQAPIADWFAGDDFHHNGAFFLIDAFDFFSGLGQYRPSPTTIGPKGFDFGTPDAYRFFLSLGPLANANERYFKGKIRFWNDLMAHGTYDEFWKARDLLLHVKKITPFDTSDYMVLDASTKRNL